MSDLEKDFALKMAKWGKANILVVDDEENCYLLFLRVARGRCNLMWASSGKEAIKILEAATIDEELGSNRFDAVISDEAMPGMEGHDLIRIVRKRWPKIITAMITGLLDPVSIKEIFDLLPMVLVPKPPQAHPDKVEEFLAGVDQARE